MEKRIFGISYSTYYVDFFSRHLMKMWGGTSFVLPTCKVLQSPWLLGIHAREIIHEINMKQRTKLASIICLTHLRSMHPFYTLWKHQKTRGKKIRRFQKRALAWKGLKIQGLLCISCSWANLFHVSSIVTWASTPSTPTPPLIKSTGVCFLK